MKLDINTKFVNELMNQEYLKNISNVPIILLKVLLLKNVLNIQM